MDGAFERINARILKEGTNSQVLSLVGRVINFTGDTATVEAADGGQVSVTQINADEFQYEKDMICEIMCSAMAHDAVQYFIYRDLGKDFDLDNYNKLIVNVMRNPKYADIFE